MGLVTVELLHLPFLLPIFGSILTLVVDLPSSIRVVRSFLFILTHIILVHVYIGNAMNTVYDLERAILDPALQHNLHNLLHHLLEHYQCASFHQPLLKYYQVGVI
jgi:hypothetical protein